MNFDELIASAVAPLPGDNPAGVVAVHEDAYGAVAAEMAKPDGLPSAPPDWRVVSERCRDLLASRTKDFVLACCLARALLELHGLAGLEVGLRILIEFVKNYWETGYPPAAQRLKARENYLGFLAEHVADWLARNATSPGELARTEAVAARLEELEAIWLSSSPGSRVLLEDVRRAVGRRLEEARASAASPTSKPAPTPSSSAPVQAMPGPEPIEIQSEDDAQAVLRSMQKGLRRVRGFLFSADPRSPIPYAINRFLAWGTLERVPDSEDGRTGIPGVQTGLIGSSDDDLAMGRYHPLLDKSEDRLFEAPLWLDLQRYSWISLERMGPEFEAARAVVALETRVLLERLPGIENLTFRTGTPFASEATRKWIRTVVLPPVPVPGPEGTSAAAENRHLDAARTLARNGNWAKALEVFQEVLAVTGAAAGRFRLILQQAQLCLEFGKADVALPLFEQLDEMMTAMDLEVWEPDLALEVVTGYAVSLGQVVGSSRTPPPQAAQLQKLKDRLIRMNPAAALGVIERV